MTTKVKAAVRKAATLIGVAAVLFFLWNIPTLVSVGTPAFRASVAVLGVAQATPNLNPNDSRIVIPRLGIDAPMKESPATSPLAFKDWDSIRAALNDGTSLNYSAKDLDSAPIAYVTGHSSDRYPHAYSSIFAPLGQAKAGDTFYLTGGGEIRKYEVKYSKVVRPDDLNGFSEKVLAAGLGSAQHVALVTCWPLFTSYNRMVVVGELVGRGV